MQREGCGPGAPQPAAPPSGGPRRRLGADRLRAVGAVCVSHRTEQLGVFTHKEFEQLAPVLDGFSLMTYDYPAAQQ